MRTLVASLMTLLSCGLGHAAMTPDPTGLWFDPDESGWGMSVAQQGETVFATIFVYDEARRPTWFVASQVTAVQTPPLESGEPLFSGTLYRTSGPWFGGGFDPHSVGVTAVGLIQLQYAAGDRGKVLKVTYSADGVPVAKTLQPQTWSDNRALLLGRYQAGLVITDKTPLCPGPIDTSAAFVMTVSDDPAANKTRIQWGTGIDTACTIEGTFTQRGQLASISGTLACGPLQPPIPWPIQLTELAIGPHGFSGAASFLAGSCTYSGHIGGVRQP